MSEVVIQGFALSPQQDRLWSISQDSINPRLTRLSCLISLQGRLDLERLESSLRAVIGRHEAFRTRLHREPGIVVPVQVIDPAPRRACRIVDLQRLDSENRQEELQRLLEAETYAVGQHETPFNSTIVKWGADCHYLLVSASALVADGMSLLIFARELEEVYGAGQASEAPGPEPMQFADFAQWHSEVLATAQSTPWQNLDLSTATAWRFPLGQMEPSLSGELRRSRPLDPLGPSTILRLTALAERYQVSLEEVLSAAWQVFQFRHTGQETVTVAWTCSGRKFEEILGGVGPYDRTLPVQACLSLDMTFEQALTATAAAMTEARDWQEYFDWAKTGSARSSFIPVAFEYSELPSPVSGSGVVFTVKQLSSGGEPSYLRLRASRQGENLELYLDYHPMAVSEELVGWLAIRLNLLVRELAEHTTTQLGQLRLVGDTEQERLVNAFSATSLGVMRPGCVHEWISQQAALTPDHVAVACGEEQLTYAELEVQATRLATRLAGLGVRPQTRVALCAERSLQQIVGIFAILKSGAGYVPVDPSYPAERVAFMLQDSAAPVLLTERSRVESFANCGAECLCLEVALEADCPAADTSFPVVSSTDLAYVIYTSGSTGTPKGVMVTHGNLAASTYARHEYYRDPVSAYLMLPSIAFDSSVAGIFWTLSQGGTLVVPEEGLQTDAQALCRLARQHKVSHWLSVPSLYSASLSLSRPGDLSSLRVVIVAGETCPPSLPAVHREQLPETALFNEYGPTEATVWCTAHCCDHHSTELSVPIGTPIPNSRVYVLDGWGNPAPIGVAGELFVGGDGVARGYLNQEELTRERFVPDPFAAEVGRELYRTGDIVRFHFDGSLEFLGRLDEQIKIRGYRIELGEIETALSRHSEIKGAVVVVRLADATSASQQSGTNSQGETLQLVAYFVGAGPQAPSPATLRDFLSSTLPQFMIPHVFVLMESLPLTPSGKVDRAALPAPGAASGPSRNYAAPRDAVETVIARIWEEVLGQECVGIHESFFELGGHSLLVAKVVARLRETFNAEILLRTLFEHPTVAMLARNLRSQPNAGSRVEQIAEIVLEIDGLPDAEVERLLSANLGTGG